MYLYGIKDENGEIKIKYHWELFEDTETRIFLYSVKKEQLEKHLKMLKLFIKNSEY